jgi:hypothetical protein
MTQFNRSVALHKAVCLMQALALAVPILASSVYAAPPLPARDALSSDAKPTGTTTSKMRQGTKVRVTKRRASSMANLARLVGRGRTMEIMVGANDIDTEIAECYGYVNRTLPDAELDRFVDDLATRIASFDRQAIVDTRELVNVASMQPDAEMQASWDAFIASVQRPAAQARLNALIEMGLGRPGDVERRLGRYTANFGK